MAVADWRENTLLQAFFTPTQPCRGGTTESFLLNEIPVLLPISQ